MKVMRTREYGEIALYIIYRNAMIDGHTISKEEDILAGLGELSNAPQLRLALNSLLDRELVVDPFDRSRKNHEVQYFMLTDAGIDLVEQRLHEEENSAPALFRDGEFGAFEEDWVSVTIDFDEVAPASDRFVSKSDNEAAYQEAIGSLAKLEDELATSNEAGSIFGDEKPVVETEVSVLFTLLDKGRVRAVPVIEYAKRCLGWIAEKAGAASIGELAKQALLAILHWLSH
ncbi:hypothetical protein [Stakelama saccharophila]|uniref:Uncharacterized protein n=1 Tax=Stakelama saccharophila TaxID=3075605 RepID=A0ABZ0BCS9_9SPHN|nr:hypothetical protein [Stakelama sp. W311]WNO55035.1 hypothetical protein RPR59_07270 [Stakelama sp. W311]